MIYYVLLFIHSLLLLFVTLSDLLIGTILVLISVLIILVLTTKVDWLFYGSIMLILTTVFFQFTYEVVIFTIVLIILNFLIKMNREKIFLSRRTVIVIIFLVLWGAYATIQVGFLLSGDFQRGQYLSLIFGIGLVSLTILTVDKIYKLRILFKFWGLFLLLFLILGLIEIITGESFKESVITPYEAVATVSFYNQNDYSLLVGLSFPVVIWFILQKNLKRIIGYVMLIMSFIVVSINDSRSILIMLLFMTILLLILLYFYKRRIELFSIITLFTFIFIIFQVEFLDSFSGIRRIFGDDNSVSERAFLTTDVFNVFINNAILGTGPGEVVHYMTYPGNQPHNFWLEILASYGIIIGVIFILGYAIYLILISCRLRINFEKIFIIFLVCLLFIPASFISSSILQFQTTWFVLGLMIATINILDFEDRTRNFKKTI